MLIELRYLVYCLPVPPMPKWQNYITSEFIDQSQVFIIKIFVLIPILNISMLLHSIDRLLPLFVHGLRMCATCVFRRGIVCGILNFKVNSFRKRIHLIFELSLAYVRTKWMLRIRYKNFSNLQLKILYSFYIDINSILGCGIEKTF